MRLSLSGKYSTEHLASSIWTKHLTGDFLGRDSESGPSARSYRPFNTGTRNALKRGRHFAGVGIFKLLGWPVTDLWWRVFFAINRLDWLNRYCKCLLADAHERFVLRPKDAINSFAFCF